MIIITNVCDTKLHLECLVSFSPSDRIFYTAKLLKNRLHKNLHNNSKKVIEGWLFAIVWAV